MKIQTLASLALALGCSTSAFAQSNGIPAECKNLALMQAQLLNTYFHDNQMSGTAYNPAQLTLKTANKMYISKTEFLGDDNGSDASITPNCSTNPEICTNPADAGGIVSWNRVTVSKESDPVAEVIVSFGSRGGCSISSAKSPSRN